MYGLRRIFYNGDLKGVIELDEASSRKLKTVLRANSGDKIEVLSYNSLGLGEIATIGKRNILVKIDSVRDIVLPKYSFTVYQCLAKREYMDWIIEKYAELGVTKIVPLVSARSLPSLKENTLERFKNIVIDAALQSENEFIPEISNCINISKINCDSDTKILFHERLGEKSYPENISNNVSIIIGAEGGFTEKETELLINKGFSSYTPIDCVLKAETAAVLFAGMVRVKLQ